MWVDVHARAVNPGLDDPPPQSRKGTRSLTPAELANAARTLLLGDPPQAASSARVAARAVDACERLSRHLARLMGEMGSRAIFNRSLLLTRRRFPWMASVLGTAGLPPGESPWAPLRAAMELQDPETAVRGFAELLSTFVELLGRLIGDLFASRLLEEAWPELFGPGEKGPP